MSRVAMVPVLEKAVGERGLAVVDMGDDAEISNVRCVHF